MLNERSDRVARRRKRVMASREFWLGAISTLVALGLMVGFLG